MSKKIFFIVAAIVTLLLGGIAGAYLIDHFHLSEMPNRFIEQPADGATVRFLYFEPMHTLGPNELRTIVIVFWDWKNNGPIKQVVYRTHNSLATDRAFYSDGDMISALVDNHVLFNYDKKTRTVTKKEFGSVYTLIKPTSDWQRIVATRWDDKGPEMVLLDGSGKELMAQPSPDLLPDNLTFIDDNQKVEIKAQTGRDTSSIFTWDLTTNQLTEKPIQDNPTDGAPQRAPTGSAVLYGDTESLDLQKNEVTFRLVEWVEGEDNKEQTALETGQCDLASIESDQCLPEPFIIRKTEKSLTLPLSADLKIRIYARNGQDGMVSGPDGGIYQTDTDVKTFNSFVKNDASFKAIPFIFTTTHGQVTQIQEQYVP